MSEDTYEAAEYQGKKVKLNKPFRTSGGSKKFAVYTKNEKGNVVIVRFGDPNMEIKRDDPKRRKAFRDRHNCANPGPKWKARYWSCKMWSSKPVNKITKTEDCSDCGCGGDCKEGGELNSPLALESAMGEKEKEVYAELPKPSSDETHDEYMSRCMEAGGTEQACMLAHEGHTFKEAGWKKKKASVEYVFFDTKITEAVAHVQASGETVVKISGIAFHEGMNKNMWQITRAGAEQMLTQMIGADLTLNHPPTKERGIGFTRNMDGGVNDAVVGIVTEAKIVDLENGGYEVHYVAEVMRTELFPALESGLWTRGDYGVSIGGYGIPIATAEDGSMTFESDFTFDHLAIVHKPAYERADIKKVEKIEASKEFIYQTDTNEEQAKEANIMSDEIDYVAELEDLKSQLVLANAIIDEKEAQEAALAEEARMELVKKASEIGLKGHEDLGADTITNLISSWEASRPVETPVVMAEATPAPDNMVSEVVEAETESNVVANYLNGELVSTDAELYGRVWNSLVASYNTGNFSMNGDGNAYKFEEAVEKGFLKITRGE